MFRKQRLVRFACIVYHRAMNYATPKDLKWLELCFSAADIMVSCGKRQYAAIIIDEIGSLIGFGYNGPPSGAKHCIDGGCPRFLEMSPNGSNYDNCVAIHAEQNAINRSDYTSRLGNGTIYVNGPPCFSCAKSITNSGITRVVCVRDDHYADFPRIAQQMEDWGMTVVIVDREDVLGYNGDHE